MQNRFFEPYRALQNHGVDVTQERIGLRFNAGGESETSKHIAAKALSAWIAARDYGYMVDSEVDTPNGEIDTLCWGLSDRLTYAIEAETSPTEETHKDKLDRYVKQLPPIDDMILLNLNEMPQDHSAQVEWVEDQLP